MRTEVARRGLPRCEFGRGLVKARGCAAANRPAASAIVDNWLDAGQHAARWSARSSSATHSESASVLSQSSSADRKICGGRLGDRSPRGRPVAARTSLAGRASRWRSSAASEIRSRSRIPEVLQGGVRRRVRARSSRLAGPGPATTRVNRARERMSRRSAPRGRGRGRSGRGRACRALLAGSAAAVRPRPAARGPPGGGSPRAHPARGPGRSGRRPVARGLAGGRYARSWGPPGELAGTPEQARPTRGFQRIRPPGRDLAPKRLRAGPARATVRSPAAVRLPGFAANARSPPAESEGDSVRPKRLNARYDPESSRARSACTAAGSSRCSVISSALPLGRIRNPPGLAPWARRIAARRVPL